MVWKQTTGVSGNIVWGDLEFAESGRMRSTWQMDRLEHLRRFVADGYYKLHHIQNINIHIYLTVRQYFRSTICSKYV